jgi:uncharacterized ferritin-like protein (DUF455 family)
MYNNFYKRLEDILKTSDSALKIEKFKVFYALYKEGGVEFEESYKVEEFKEPSYQNLCKIVPPQDVPKRRNLTTRDGQVVFLHAIAHIEYSAIDLALDAAYRFHDLDKEYYDEWLEVADDEVRHFEMLEKLLHKLDAKYGDVEVHNSLFEASQRTQTLLERMAVVPRYLEANGLDATPTILQKLKKLPKNEMIESIVSALELILEEEIEHVKKGDRWFNYACKRSDKLPTVYFEIIEKYYPQGFLRAKTLNVDARKEAGFSCDELEFMAKKRVC